MPDSRAGTRRTLLLDLLAAVLIPGFVFWLLFWLAKSMGYDVRGLSNMVAASSWLDVGWYTGIAERGYWIDPSGPFSPSAFFPLWPALIALFKPLTGLSATTEAAFWLQRVVAGLCCFSLIRYARSRPGRAEAHPEVDAREQLSPYELALFMFLQPAAIFLVVPYAEGLYLLLLSCVLLQYREIQVPFREGIPRYATLFGLAFLLGTCRPNGLFLGLAAALHGATLAVQRRWKSPDLAKTLVVACAAVAAVLAVGLTMYAFTGEPLSLLTGRGGWNEAPGIHQLVRRLEPQLGGMRTMETLYIYACLGGSVLLLRARRRLEGLYCLACVLLPAYQGKAGEMMRYGLAAMPALLMLQTRLARHRFWYVVLWACCTTVAVEVAFRWFTHQWPG